ncbi:MAG: hypothetical protein ACI3W5_17580 [Faecousia sp.]
MSNAEILSLVSLLSYIIAGISLVIAVFFWFAFKIPSVIGDLSGRTARKSIARMRASNEKAGGQGYKPSATNARRGKLTDTIQHSGKMNADTNKKPAVEPKEKTARGDQMPETGLLAANKAGTVESQQTALLEDAEATGMLMDDDATVALHEEPQQPAKRTGGKKLTMLDEVILIHTDEVI